MTKTKIHSNAADKLSADPIVQRQHQNSLGADIQASEQGIAVSSIDSVKIPSGNGTQNRGQAMRTLQRAVGNTRVSGMLESPIQMQSQDSGQSVENHTGMPDRLKTGLEQLSGIDLSDTRVHYNSVKPAQINALAYTQGQDIHVGPGQEKHLPHEGWHVVQQIQGRVKPTMQAKGVSINDDEGLEHEADVMGIKALQMRRSEKNTLEFPLHFEFPLHPVVQGAWRTNGEDVPVYDGETSSYNPAVVNNGTTVVMIKEDILDKKRIKVHVETGVWRGLTGWIARDNLVNVQGAWRTSGEDVPVYDGETSSYNPAVVNNGTTVVMIKEDILDKKRVKVYVETGAWRGLTGWIARNNLIDDTERETPLEHRVNKFFDSTVTELNLNPSDPSLQIIRDHVIKNFDVVAEAFAYIKENLLLLNKLGEKDTKNSHIRESLSGDETEKKYKPYAILPLLSEWREKDNKNSRLEVFDKDARKNYVYRIDEGILSEADDTKTPLDTTKEGLNVTDLKLEMDLLAEELGVDLTSSSTPDSVFSSIENLAREIGGSYIFVMNASGEIFAAREKIDILHHSSFLAGGAVAAAGTIRVRNGQIEMVSNMSGHYKPGPAYLWQALVSMAIHGVDLEKIEEIRVLGLQRRFKNAAHFVDSFNPTEFPIFFNTDYAISFLENIRVLSDEDCTKVIEFFDSTATELNLDPADPLLQIIRNYAIKNFDTVAEAFAYIEAKLLNKKLRAAE